MEALLLTSHAITEYSSQMLSFYGTPLMVLTVTITAGLLVAAAGFPEPLSAVMRLSCIVQMLVPSWQARLVVWSFQHGGFQNRPVAPLQQDQSDPPLLPLS